MKILTDAGIVVACVGYDFATTISLDDVTQQAIKALHVSENLQDLESSYQIQISINV